MPLDKLTSRLLSARTAPLGWWLAAVLIAAFLATLAFWVLVPSRFQGNENSDYRSFYAPVGDSLLRGDGYIRDGRPGTRYAPGYPLLVAGLFWVADQLHLDRTATVTWANLLWMPASAALLFLIGYDLYGPIRALIPAALWMAYPFALWLTKQPNSEPPFMVALYAGFLLFILGMRRPATTVRPALYFWAGMLIGVAMLIRPIAVLLSLLLAVLVMAFAQGRVSRRAVCALTLVIGSAVPVIPWEIWAYQKTGKVILLSTGGVPGIRNGLTFPLSAVRSRPTHFSPGIDAMTRRIRARYDEMRTLGDVARVLVGEFRTDARSVAEFFGIKALRSWYANDSGRLEGLIALVQLPYLILLAWGSIGAWKSGTDARKLLVVVWSAALYFWAMTIISLSILRYMVPALGILFILIPYGLPGRQPRPGDVSSGADILPATAAY
jgi:hypothetical protein